MNRLIVVLLTTFLAGSTALAIRGSSQREHSIVNYAGDAPTDASTQDKQAVQLQHADVVATNVERMGGRNLVDTVDPAGGGFINSIPEYSPGLLVRPKS